MLGTRIISSPLAVRVCVEFRVERTRVKKRRRSYVVCRHQWEEPGCYRLADGTMVMHPSLIEKLKETTNHGN